MITSSVATRGLLGSVVCAVWLTTAGCSPFHSLKFAEQNTNEPASFTGAATEFGRGLSNVGGCWMEIPYSMDRRYRQKAADRDRFSFIGFTYDTVIGLTDGVLRTGQRALAGVVEIIISPFPPYGPLVEPASPFHMFPVRLDDASPDDGERAGILKMEFKINADG